MAAKVFYRKGFLLLLFNFISTAALDKKFSDLKRCTDEECSMLLCRGKAVSDFTGPDCRFLSFKKSETIYVYYKLSGRRADLWAGSVGNRFGYFPKDLLAVNHIYTEKELEVPAEETDFVCFDTGYDKFDNYDVDSLLGSSTLVEDDEIADASYQPDMAEVAEEERQPSTDETTDAENNNDDHDNSEDLDSIPGDQSASLSQPDGTTESLTTELVQSDTGVVPDAAERDTEDTEQEQQITENLTNPEVEPQPTDDPDSENEPDSVSKGMQIPELKTTLGSTFDAVTTDDEDTWKVTPYEEGESEELKDHHDENQDTQKETPLLSSEKAADTPESNLLNRVESPSTTHDDDDNDDDDDDDNDDNDLQTSEDNTMWTSLGDTVFAIVSGGEKTTSVTSSEENEDDEEEEEITSKPPQRTEEAKEEDIKLLSADPPEEQQSKEFATSNSVETGDEDSEPLLFDYDDEHHEEVAKHENDQDDMSTVPADEQNFDNETEESTTAEYPTSRDNTSVDPQPHTLDIKTLDEPTKEEVSEDSEVHGNDALTQDHNTSKRYNEDMTTNFDEVKTPTSHQELPVIENESKEEEKSKDSESKGYVEEKGGGNLLNKKYGKHSVSDLEKNKSKHSHREFSVEETELNQGLHIEEKGEELSKDTEEEENGELLEDENAVSFTQSHTSHPDIDKPSLETALPTSEPEYSDSILRLTLLRDHFKEKDMERFQKSLGLKNLFKLEAMFSDLEQELQDARLSHTGTSEEIEKQLEVILEASENSILDKIEKMLDSRNLKHEYGQQMDTGVFDEEVELLDDFQELAFRLRQKYSVASDSAPLTDRASHVDQDEHALNEKETPPHTVENEYGDNPTEEESDGNLTVTDVEEGPPEKEEEQIVLDEVHKGPDISVEKDGGHFNKNKDNQPGFTAAEEMQKVPQAILENPFDMSLGVEMEHSSGPLDTMEPASDFHEEELGLFSSGMLYTVCLLAMIKTKIGEWVVVIISLMPEEWKPGETLFGCPWQAVVITSLIGVFTFTLFFWKTVLAVKKKEYLVDEKGLNVKMKALKQEKNDAISKITELQKQTEDLKEKQKRSQETASCALKRNQDLESKVLAAETLNKQVAEEKNTYSRLFEEERTNSLKNAARIEKLEKSNEKLQLSRKKTQETLAKTTVLLDEAKIREDARSVHHKCLERDYAGLKEENKTLKATIKGWEDKHKELSEQIKIYQKSQKELEDSVVLKDHNVEVLSELLADLDACDLQKSDTKVLANGEVATDKKTAIKSRIKQMMDVSRVQTTLTVVEEERDRFMTKLLNEEKTRKSLEEQHQELEHSIATLKSEKSHVENQFKILQQKNEIMTEMYQQKENALQQRLTKEELERRSKESLLSEVGGKALEAEEQVKVLRQRINEMEDQMKKTEEVYKEQIKEQENKTHSNWVNARNAERALNQEKVETSKLREKLGVLTSQLNERRAPLFRPNSGQPLGLRQGDSYGPSPVSGGAPSPPPMIEGPRRPPSAPVGRRIDPYGPRPPSDPHGRYPDNKHTSGIDMMAPRTSSPANMDGSGPGSFVVSPIRDSTASVVQGPPSAPGSHGPPAGPGPHDLLPPHGPLGRLPPPGPHRPLRPGQGPHGHLYHSPAGMIGPHGPLPPNVPPHGPPLPANGHPGLPPPGPMGGEFGPRPSNGHALRPRPGPGHATDPRGPPPPHFRPPPHHFGPMPPPHGVRGPMGPRPPFPPDMRFPGPRDHAYPPVHLPPGGVPPHVPHGDSFVQAPLEAPHIPVGPYAGPGQGQDLSMKQDAAPQDSVRPAMAEP
ncbi:transport and Golgi organization protein 1 homolog isoform 2-T2 [Polymixia lowei]